MSGSAYPTLDDLRKRFGGGKNLTIRGREGVWRLHRAYTDVYGTHLLVLRPMEGWLKRLRSRRVDSSVVSVTE